MPPPRSYWTTAAVADVNTTRSTFTAALPAKLGRVSIGSPPATTCRRCRGEAVHPNAVMTARVTAAVAAPGSAGWTAPGDGRRPGPVPPLGTELSGPRP